MNCFYMKGGGGGGGSKQPPKRVSEYVIHDARFFGITLSHAPVAKYVCSKRVFMRIRLKHAGPVTIAWKMTESFALLHNYTFS